MAGLARIHAALERVVDPCSIATGAPINLIEMGLLVGVADEGGAVTIRLRLTTPVCWQAGNIIARVEEVVGAIPGVRSVSCTIDPRDEWAPAMMSAAAQARLRRLRPIPPLPHPG